MQAEIDVQILRDLTRTLLDPATDPGTLRDTTIRMFDLFSRICGLDDHSPSVEDSRDTILEHGKAISPLNAARCVLDLARTAKYLRGVQSAIDEAQRRFPDEIVHVLYAGCGPFAPLVLPLATIYGHDRLQFTLLDIHHQSLRYAKRIVETLGLSASVRRFVQGDATHYEHPDDSPFHVLVIEVLQKGLTEEPQVAITLNLVPQLHDNGILVPERITLTACYADLQNEIKLLPADADRSDFEVAPDGRKKRAVLGVAFELSAETARLFGKELPGHDAADTLRLPGHTLPTKPRPSKVHNLVIFTTITVYGSIVLGDYQSGVTQPCLLEGPSVDAEHESMAFVYRLGKNPGLSYDLY